MRFGDPDRGALDVGSKHGPTTPGGCRAKSTPRAFTFAPQKPGCNHTVGRGSDA